MREVKVFEGGQTVTLGKVISVMGRTSTEVEMGLSLHPLKDWRMSETEQEKPAATTASQNSLSRFREAGMWDRPGNRVETSHWSRSTEILCSDWMLPRHKEPAQGTQSPLLGAFLVFRWFFMV